jgi:hypothetical protein
MSNNKKQQIMKAEITQAILENKKITTGFLEFTSSFNNYKNRMIYFMQDKYNVDKWKDYDNEKEYTKAIMQRVNYYTKKGFTNAITINN